MAFGDESLVQCDPVVRGATYRRGVDVPDHLQHTTGPQRLERIVGSREIHLTLHGNPLPARSKDDSCPRPHPQVGELPGPSSRHEADDSLAGDRVVEHAGVHHRCLSRPVGPACGDDRQAALQGAQLPRSIKEGPIHLRRVYLIGGHGPRGGVRPGLGSAVGRVWHRWPVWPVASLVFLVVLFGFFNGVNRLLPAGC